MDYPKQTMGCVYQRYSRVLFFYIYTLVCDYELSRDLVQDTFIKYYQHIEILDDRRIIGWLRTVARRLYMDHLRKVGRMQFWVDCITEDNSEEDNKISLIFQKNNPASICVEEICTLHQLLNNLPFITRQCIQLSVFEGYTKKEISLTLGISERTVMRKIKLAKEILAQRLLSEIE